MENVNFKAYLDEKNTITILSDKESSFTINGDFLHAYYVSRFNQYYVYKANVEIDINQKYVLKDDYNRESVLSIRYYVKDDSFDEKYYYDGDNLGSNYHKEHTTFKLWAPIASDVKLHYEMDNQEYEVTMYRKDKGVFEVDVKGDLANALYYYKVTNNGVTNDVIDPYAYSSNANSKKSAVIDLSRIRQNTYASPTLKRMSDAIIYELSVRDFSMDNSLGEDVSGLFKAFLKEGMKSPKGNPIGIDYIKQLGITHVQLMPIIDFATVNEENIKEKYNWGYDPVCYNSLEGSFSTNANDPYARINEALEMIDKFHQLNIGVILDVVFNHTYEFINSVYNKIIPNYFYLMDRNGNLSNGSFCGNDVDTTRKMAHKYFVDMVMRYVTLYKIDGLRYDLMGILTKDLIQEIYNKAKAINPSFIAYGEGWNMPSFLPEHKRASLNNANQIPAIGFFNDYFRDIASGKCFNNFSHTKGYLNGNISLYYDFMKAMRGSIENGCYFLNSSSSINYVECHDNFTLFDKLKITNVENTNEERNNIQLCMLAAILLAQGTPFLHMGTEFNRTKKGNENSYNAGDKINMIRWESIDENIKNIKAVRDFIKIRKTFPCFNIGNRKKILNSVDGQIFDGVLQITYAYNGDVIILLFNPTNQKVLINLSGEYKLYANQLGILKDDDKVYTQVKIKPYSFLMLIK